MKVKALRNIITKNYGPINKGTEIEVPDSLGKSWVEGHVAEAVTVEKPAVKKSAPKKETADSKVKKEVR